jgi:hypothetical protein
VIDRFLLSKREVKIKVFAIMLKVFDRKILGEFYRNFYGIFYGIFLFFFWFF